MVHETKRIRQRKSSPSEAARIRRAGEAERVEDSALRWSVEQRLSFIEERLFWLGEVNRTDLVRHFGVSMGQASADIGRYLAHAPKGVAYDKRAKRYVANVAFRPVLGAPDAARFLGELRLVEAGLLPAEKTMLGTIPVFDATPVPERKIDAFVLRAALTAMRKRLALQIIYQSMSRPEPLARAIEPHALAHDGFRWHLRAFDRESGEFRDFVLGRISRPRVVNAAQSQPNQDRDWHTFVTLEIAPHPDLTEAQAKAVALDYGITKGAAKIPVRRSMLFYALRRLGLDLKPNARPPQEQHIVLVNRSVIEDSKTPPAQT
jgi:hypothetical protein